MTSFENYLKEIHMLCFPSTLDDDLPDAFDNWLSDLDVEEVLRYGQLFGEKTFLEGHKATLAVTEDHYEKSI